MLLVLCEGLAKGLSTLGVPNQQRSWGRVYMGRTLARSAVGLCKGRRPGGEARGR